MRSLSVPTLIVLSLFVFMTQTASAESLRVTARIGVNLRSASGRVIGIVPRGATVRVERSFGNWVYITYNGKRGRIYRKFTSRVASSNNYRETRTSRPQVAQSRYTGGGKGRGKYFNPARATSGSCGDIVVDCRSHRISFSGARVSAADSVVNCGKYGKTKNGYGVLGGMTGGRRVPVAIDIRMKGMGTSAGGKWLHLPWWNGNMRPTGLNSSRGCIHISPAVMSLMKRCEGSRIQIKNALGSPQNRNGRSTDEGEAKGYY